MASSSNQGKPIISWRTRVITKREAIGGCTAPGVYVKQHADTQPLYQGYAEQDHAHFASTRSDCEGQGKNEKLLGYDLVR
jgi:hypothetical protein